MVLGSDTDESFAVPESEAVGAALPPQATVADRAIKINATPKSFSPLKLRPNMNTAPLNITFVKSPGIKMPISS
jgi:hypothetical protein